jgi:hypothetical protein
MVALSFPSLRFYLLRTLRTQPVTLGALVLSMACLAVASVLLFQQMNRLGAARAELARMGSQPQPAVKREQPADAAIPDLPPFASAPFVAALNEAASDSGVTLDEVRYALDDSAGMPYLRYRVTLGVTAGYPLVRKMAERIQATMPNATIDAIHCTRKSPLFAELNCELALSGLFRRMAAHG